MAGDTEYLTFERVAPAAGRKTPTVLVRSKNLGIVLGRIAWFGRWRQFCFFPEAETVFNVGCMTDIQAQIAGLMAERRPARRV